MLVPERREPRLQQVELPLRLRVIQVNRRGRLVGAQLGEAGAHPVDVRTDSCLAGAGVRVDRGGCLAGPEDFQAPLERGQAIIGWPAVVGDAEQDLRRVNRRHQAAWSDHRWELGSVLALQAE